LDSVRFCRNPAFQHCIVLRGSELRAKPLQENSPIVLRILNAFPHGDSFRYDIRFHGLEPGKFDLSNWLERKDGSPSDDLPAIDVEIQSLLPAGQITPNALETGWFPRLGGYRVVAIGLGLLWTLILLGLIFLNRKKAVAEEESEAKMSLADLLKQKIDAATDDRLDSSQYAELERMLFGFWRKRLNLESVSSADALAKIKQHDEAGPLMRQLEQWMHNPSSPKDVNLASMLKPFKNLPANTPGFEEQPGFETQ